MLKVGLDVEFRPPPPDPARVARRALLLAALACRAQLEPHAADPEARALWARVAAWRVASGIDAEAEPAEQALLAAGLGTLGAAADGIAAGSGEAAAVLAWGVARYALPAIDADVDAADVGAALGWLDPDVGTAIEAARLRPRTDVILLAEALEVAEWRLTAARDGAAGASLVQFGADRVRTAADAAPLPLAADGDLRLGDTPLAAAPATARAAALVRVRARRRAVNWLAGQVPAYGEVRLDL